jgi:Tol biopolymer transport system component
MYAIPVPCKFEVPGMENAWHITFEPDGKTLYYVTVDYTKKMEVIKYSVFRNGKWSVPKFAEFSGKYRIETPRVSPDGMKFFFTYATPGQENIYVMNKTSNGWSEPIDLGSPINTPAFEGCPSVALNGNLYFFSSRDGNFRIYCSRFVDGSYSEPVALDMNNNKDGIGEFFIAPDESYLLYDISTAPDSCQLYISFNRNGSWSIPQNLGKEINFSNFQKRPCVSPDGNYLFYTGKEGQYQVDFNSLIDSLKTSL